ncbi:hypothetical protein NSS64_24250 [Paenibacillus sp. FSL H8-0122]|uniref:hypothetical protein n=1 Tax=unclassified Paenibacillus TaxID=185978 RepID=UPI0030F834D0
MKLYVTVKSLGKRKAVLERKELLLASHPQTLRALISEIVAGQVQAMRERQEQGELIPYLTASEIAEQGDNGKVGFGTVYGETKPEVEQATAAALLAFEDGLYKVFVQEEECSALDEPLRLEEGDELTLIRFTMLAGRLW